MQSGAANAISGLLGLEVAHSGSQISNQNNEKCVHMLTLFVMQDVAWAVPVLYMTTSGRLA